VVLRFVKTITLHLGILAKVMFLAGTDEEQSDTARDDPGAEQSGTHSDANCSGEGFGRATKSARISG